MARLLARSNFEIPATCLPVLTGAGASVAYGYPLMKPAGDQFRSFLRTLPESASRGASRRGRLQHYVGWITEEMRNRDEYIDLETLLLILRSHVSYLARGEVHGLASRLLDPQPRLIANDDLSALEGLLDLELGIKEYIHQTYGQRPGEDISKQVAETFRELDRSVGRPFALFTTNYDPIAESVPELIGKESLDGFRRTPMSGPETWNPEVLSEFDRSRHLPVFHLHGSASWFAVDGEVRRYPGLRLGADSVQSMLVYPGEAKDDLDAEQSDVSRLAYNYLTQCTSEQGVLVAIGYSFRDARVRRTLQLAAGYRQRSIHLFVLAPNLDEHVEGLFAEPHIKGEFIRANFEDADGWSPILRTLIRNALTW